MFTHDEVNELLRLPKKVVENGVPVDVADLSGASYPFELTFDLVSLDENAFVFRYDIQQSKKNLFKLSLYLMEDESRIGLLRVDYRGQHKNPEIITDKVPEVLRPFAGKFFDYEEPHIHYYVEGYKTTLDWALPLQDDAFSVKAITHPNNVLDAFYCFNEIIHLETQFNTQLSLL